MKIGFAEEYTSNIELDNELKLNSKTGIILNSGVHPYITVDNLLHFLPFNEIEFKDYVAGTVYNKYSETQDRNDIVKHNNSLYQCLKNEVEDVEPGSDSNTWMLTNKESIILKSWIEKVKDKVISDLYLSKRLINSQYIYENGENKHSLPNDYSGWVFESKGSDYITITMNEISLQATTSNPVNLFVINDGELVDTLILNPKDGRLSFEQINYSFSGRGKWVFAIESREVMTNFGWVDELKYDGFVCYPVSGIGTTPDSSIYSYQNASNGLGFNVSVTLESENYLNYNLQNFVGFFKACFEYLTLQMFLANSHQRSNRTENGINKDMLMVETKDLEANTSAKRYFHELKEAKKIIQKTFDTQLGYDSVFEVEVTSV
ncbi:hypothetical protein [Chryseobacterium sp.]|jgi:hypothetical protein|uniref:hypothetical protein n=1 Tax=Chryseobacterium sp. TaxID=1871047 RepID=UPI00283C9F39|nr:hypothetical protein [Chryseobacterium sp.]MDR3026057.1 hypothetical protein [Chryseobacterium sp.]